MRTKWKRRLPSLAVALAAVTAVFVASTTPAFAGQWGEETEWTPEFTAGAPISTPDTLAEAWDAAGNNVAQIWRNADGSVRLDINHGHEINFGGRTGVAPRIVQYGASFAIFYTGLNGVVYYRRPWNTTGGNATYLSNPDNWMQWTPLTQSVEGVPFVTPTFQSVSVFRLRGAQELFMVYRGSDGRIYGNYLNNLNPSVRQSISNWQSEFAPTGTFNPQTNQIVVAISGQTDHYVYTTRQTYGGSGWSNWEFVGGEAASSPVIVSDSHGSEMVAGRTNNGYLLFNTRDYRTHRWSGWSAENTHWRTRRSPWLIAVAGLIFIAMIGFDDYTAYYKVAYDPPV
jgi:hypothetical protein